MAAVRRAERQLQEYLDGSESELTDSEEVESVATGAYWPSNH